jgi:uncharacterized integral membrane protein
MAGIRSDDIATLEVPARPAHQGDVMSVLHPTRSDPTGQNRAPDPPVPATQDGAPAPAETRAGSRTRLSTAWVSIWTATVVFIALIVFMLQNTRSVEVSFLGLHGTLPLALALLITAAGAVLLTLIFGTARITQLRRRLSRSRHS